MLLVSAFLNAPPTPDPVIVLAAQQSYFAHKVPLSIALCCKNADMQAMLNVCILASCEFWLT